MKVFNKLKIQLCPNYSIHVYTHFQELAEEHDALIQAKSQAEEDLIKLENKLQEILQKYESQARKQHGNFETQYSVLTPESRQVCSSQGNNTAILRLSIVY